MNCKNCGAQLMPNSNFCSHCGTNNAINQPVQYQQMPQYQQPMQYQNYNQNVPMYNQQPIYPGQVAQPIGNMPMTYHYVYMILMALSSLVNIVDIINGKQVDTSNIVILLLIIGMLIGLFLKKKVGRILALVYNVFLTIGGVMLSLASFTVQDMYEELGLGVLSEGATSYVLFIGIACAVWGILTFIYYKKREIMFK